MNIITKKVRPSVIKVEATPISEIRTLIVGPQMAEAKPNPIIARPVAKPRLSGNHFTKVETGEI